MPYIIEVQIVKCQQFQDIQPPSVQSFLFAPVSVFSAQWFRALGDPSPSWLKIMYLMHSVYFINLD